MTQGTERRPAPRPVNRAICRCFTSCPRRQDPDRLLDPLHFLDQKRSRPDALMPGGDGVHFCGKGSEYACAVNENKFPFRTRHNASL